MDLVTNISNRPEWSHTIGDANFVNNPCMVLKHGVFLDNFDVYHSSAKFTSALENIPNYKKVLESDLNKNCLSNGLFSVIKSDFGILNCTKHNRL